MNLSKRVWTIYRDDIEQRVAVYTGTSYDEIIILIKQLFKINENQNLLFLDEDGIPIVISSAIPNNTKIYLQIHQSVTEKFFNENQQIVLVNWTWLEPGNDSHKRKNNNMTIFQPVNRNQSYCYGSLVIEKGTHYFTLLFEPLMCCVFAGVHRAGENLRNLSSSFLTDINLPSLFENKIKSSLKSAIYIGFLVDMNKKILVITSHQDKEIKKSFKIPNEWEKVSPLVYFKHEVSITIVDSKLEIPEWAKNYS